MSNKLDELRIQPFLRYENNYVNYKMNYRDKTVVK